jgi:mannose-6-phosphate isomerase-like protein (cupin superfamily)
MVIQNRVELGPEAPAFRHWHPGEEIIYVLEGKLEYTVDGVGAKTYSAGDALTIPAERIHSVKNVGGGGRACHIRRREGQAIPRARRRLTEHPDGLSHPDNPESLGGSLVAC